MAAAAALAAILYAPAPAGAQSLVWAGYGHNSDHATRLTTGEALQLGYALFRPASGAAATVGVPLDPDASSRWATLAGWLESAIAGPVGVSASASGFAFHDPLLESSGVGSIVALDTHGTLDLGRAELRLRLGARHGAHMGDDGGSQRLLGRAGTAATARFGAMEARAELDHWLAEEAGYTQVAARASFAQPRIQAWAGIAHWADASLPGTGWDVGVRVPVTDRVAITGRGGVPAQDILFWIPRQQTWSVAVQLRTGAPTLAAALPVPAVHDAGRGVTFTLPARGLEGQPAVAGSFSGWRPVPMERARDGWRLHLSLEPGVHEYAFVTEDGTWFVPERTPGRKPDGFGGFVAVLIVE
jgi:hypothetical protein